MKNLETTRRQVQKLDPLGKHDLAVHLQKSLRWTYSFASGAIHEPGCLTYDRMCLWLDKYTGESSDE